MSFAAYIARRYLLSRGGSRLVSRVTVIAVTGIMLGVMVLDLTLAIMNGLHTELRRTFIENMPMVTVVTSRPEGFTRLGETIDTIGQLPEVTGVAPFIRQEVVITSQGRAIQTQHRAGVVWGVDPDLQETVTPLSHLVHPSEKAIAALRGGEGVPGIVLGAELAASLYAGLGDTVTITAPTGDLDLHDLNAESRRFVVAGFLDTGLYDFDARFVYMPLEAARDFFGYDTGGATGIGVKVADMMRAPDVADSIETALGPFAFHCNDWIDLNRNLFQWVSIEKILMFLLLGLVILVAAFNIVGILTMMVGERRREIGIMLSMGASKRQVEGIFVLEGLFVGAMGTLLGSLFGYLGFMYLDRVGISVPGDVYFVDHVPVVAQTVDFLLVAAVAMGITLMATLLPSAEAARLRPMEIIRYT